MLSLLKECQIVKVMDSQAAGVTDPASDIVDTAGFEGCCFICKLGTVVDAAAVSMAVQQNTVNNAAGMAALTGATAEIAVAVALTDSEQSLVVDVYRPRERYLRAAITRDTQNSEIDAVYAILYNPRNIPVTQPTTIAASAHVVSPAEV